MQTGDPRKKLPLIDNVIAAVDVEGVSGAGFRRLMGEERNGKADVLGGHELAGRRFSLRSTGITPLHHYYRAVRP
jgi:hypothetical protein